MSITSSYQSPNPLAALAQARSQTDSLFALVSPEKFYDRPIAERHRMIFYLGHLEAFDWNLVCRRALDVPSFHQEFDKLFAFGIDPPVGQLPQDQPSDWPSIEEVTSYNHRVRETLDRLMDNAPRQLIQCAIEHRLMHADTFAYILHNENHARPLTPLPPSSPPPLEMISIPAGTATLGLSGDASAGTTNSLKQAFLSPLSPSPATRSPTEITFRSLTVARLRPTIGPAATGRGSIAASSPNIHCRSIGRSM